LGFFEASCLTQGNALRGLRGPAYAGDQRRTLRAANLLARAKLIERRVVKGVVREYHHPFTGARVRDHPGGCMLIVYECVACALAALAAATLLCTAGVVFLLLKQGARILAPRLCKLTQAAAHLKGRWIAAESLDS